jgi:Fe2+ transport protein
MTQPVATFRRSTSCKLSAIGFGALPLVLALFAGAAFAQVIEPRPKALAPATDPVKDGVLIGRTSSDGMVLQLEIEGTEPMWMQMGSPPVWSEHQPAAAERYHVEAKVTDPETKTRIPYAAVTFTATHTETGKSTTLPLLPMWGSSGLHYSENTALLGDGAYAVLLTVDVPTFQRELKDKDLWPKPVAAKFHFKLQNGMLVEVTEPDF